LRTRLDVSKRFCIVGGGFIGLECAATLRKLGKSVQVIEREKRLLNRVCSEPIADFLTNAHHSHGVDILLGTAIVSAVLQGDTLQLQLDNGTTFEADEVIVGVGVVPNTELAVDCGLAVEHGIVTNQHGQTSDNFIYAVGDCARFQHSLYNRLIRLESVDNAFEQGRSLSRHLVEQEPVEHKVPWFWSDQYDHKLLMAGLSFNPEAIHIRHGSQDAQFSVGLFERGQLQAIECLNQPKDWTRFRKLLNNNEIITVEQFLA
jgi:3-phenylpropionate/trans-cinnamate dioxygenase ferredoxin reductase subunit